MASQLTNTISTGRRPSKKGVRPALREKIHGTASKKSIAVRDRDEEEEQLSRLVFGEEADFTSQLARGDGNYGMVDADAGSPSDDGQSDADLNELDDAAVWLH